MALHGAGLISIYNPMALKILTTNFASEGTSVKLGFALIDDVEPLVTLATTDVAITTPKGSNNTQLRAFVAAESLKAVQSWYNTWQAQQAGDFVKDSNRIAIETYINSNITL